MKLIAMSTSGNFGHIEVYRKALRQGIDSHPRYIHAFPVFCTNSAEIYAGPAGYLPGVAL